VPRLRMATALAATAQPAAQLTAQPTATAQLAVAAEPAASRGPAGELDPVS
jgi:hypothetical protein